MKRPAAPDPSRRGRRLDAWLVEKGHFDSRARAQDAIREGLVRVAGAVAEKPSITVRSDAEVEVLGAAHPYVSRGGVKLAAALDAFALDPSGKVALDLGASTGGFADVLLRRGACKIYAVDVGTGQLHQSIADDPRVVNLEKTHAKDLSRALISDAIEVLVVDVSFIGLRKAAPPALALCAPGATLVALVKPQFELGPAKIGKGGIVEASAGDYAALVAETQDWLESEAWQRLGVIDSPILGGDGNKEFLIGARRPT